MFHKIIITFLFCLPLSTVFAAQAETSPLEIKYDSNAYHNLALKSFNEKNLGKAKAYIERSLYINPLSSSSRELNSVIIEKLTESIGTRRQEAVPGTSRFLDFIPSSIPYIFLIIALFLVSFSLAKVRFTEDSSFKSQPQLRLKTTALTFLLFCATLLYWAKESAQSTSWACVTSSEVELFTGPSSKDFVQTGSLPQGSCIEVVQVTKNWLALEPLYSPSGWASRSDTMLVRSYKFDPPNNKD